MGQEQNSKTHPKMKAEIECQDNAKKYNWGLVLKGALHKFSPSYMPNILVTLAFAFIGPGIGLLMKKPIVIVYGSGIGVCILVMVFTYFIAQQFSEDPKVIKNTQVTDIKVPESKPQPSIISLPHSTNKTATHIEKHDNLPIAEPHQSAYSHLTNDHLKKEVLILVDKMRGYLERKRLQDQNKSDYYSQQMRQAKTEAERHIVWDAQTHDSLTATPLNFEYSEKFKAEATLLHDELIKRLPNAPNNNPMQQTDYEHPTNPIGLNMVIDDLERLAKSLPK